MFPVDERKSRVDLDWAEVQKNLPMPSMDNGEAGKLQRDEFETLPLPPPDNLPKSERFLFLRDLIITGGPMVATILAFGLVIPPLLTASNTVAATILAGALAVCLIILAVTFSIDSGKK